MMILHLLRREVRRIVCAMLALLKDRFHETWTLVEWGRGKSVPMVPWTWMESLSWGDGGGHPRLPPPPPPRSGAMTMRSRMDC